ATGRAKASGNCAPATGRAEAPRGLTASGLTARGAEASGSHTAADRSGPQAHRGELSSRGGKISRSAEGGCSGTRAIGEIRNRGRLQGSPPDDHRGDCGPPGRYSRNESAGSRNAASRPDAARGAQG